jgi:hypothetical protein
VATDLAARSSAAHRTAVTQSLQDVARFLVDQLGVALTAHIAGVDRCTITRWADGSPARAEAERTCGPGFRYSS